MSSHSWGILSRQIHRSGMGNLWFKFAWWEGSKNSWIPTWMHLTLVNYAPKWLMDFVWCGPAASFYRWLGLLEEWNEVMLMKNWEQDLPSGNINQHLTPNGSIVNKHFGAGTMLNCQDNTLKKDTPSPLMDHHVTKEVNLAQAKRQTLDWGCCRVETGRTDWNFKDVDTSGPLGPGPGWNSGQMCWTLFSSSHPPWEAKG